MNNNTMSDTNNSISKNNCTNNNSTINNIHNDNITIRKNEASTGNICFTVNDNHIHGRNKTQP